MPNIADVLRSEIRRLAQKEAKSAVGELKKENNDLKRQLADLTKRLNQMEKQSGKAPADERSYVTQLNEARVRITGEMIRGLRERLALTQSELAHLLDVSAQSVYQWERNLGSLNLRQRTLQAVMEVRDLGKREVKRRLEQAGLLSDRRRGPITRGGSEEGEAEAAPAKKRATRKKRAAKKKPAAKKKASAKKKPAAKKKASAKKKPAAKKKASAKKKAGAKRGPGRPRGSRNKPK